LWIKPATFVHQATQSVAVDVVVLDGVFVMDRIEQALVGDVQQGHSRCFVDAAGFGFNNAIFDLVGNTQAVAATNGVGFQDQCDRVGVCDAVNGNGPTFGEAYGAFVGLDL